MPEFVAQPDNANRATVEITIRIFFFLKN
jgi:hypothetical protein